MEEVYSDGSDCDFHWASVNGGWIKQYIMSTSVRRFYFWSFFVVAHFLPSTVTPSSPPHHLLIITVSTFLPHALTQAAFHPFSLSPSASVSVSLLCRSSSHPSVPYHYYEPSGPDECSMYLSHESSRRGSHHRFITEKAVFANWARTLNIGFHQPDWKPTAAISGSNSSHMLFQRGSWDSDWRCGHVLQLINRESGTILLLLLTCCIISLAELDRQHKGRTKAHVLGV